jgi:Ala-tRNA(Pro) deacylase
LQQRASIQRGPSAAAAVPGYTAAMATDRAGLLRRLDELGIAYTTCEHTPVYTVEEAERHTGGLPGGHCKNLFLKDRKGGLSLLICLKERRIDLNRLAKVLGCARLSFGQADLLEAVLGVAPGGVTPFALINDRERRVQALLDRAMLDCALLNYHPLTNAATTTIAAADLIRFIEACGHLPRIIDLDSSGVAVG